MISREDFVFTVGYEGKTAVVDGNLKKRMRKLSPPALAKEGLYKQALCAAIYDNQLSKKPKGSENLESLEVVLEKVLAIFNKNTEAHLSSVEDLKRTFGVFEVPEGIVNTQII